MNLFGYEHQKVDVNAGLSSFDKFSKFNVKSNVNMVVDGFAPFTKAKRVKSPTVTVLSKDGENVKGAEANRGITLVKSTKTKNICINNDTLTGEMENIHVDKQAAYFEDMCRYSYGTFAVSGSMAAFSFKFSSDHNSGAISDNYMYNIDNSFAAAKALVGGYFPKFKEYIKKLPEDNPALSKDSIPYFIESSINGKNDSDLHRLIESSNKSPKDWNIIVDKIESMINEDIIDGSSKTCEEETILPRFDVYTAGSEPSENDEQSSNQAVVGNGDIEYNEAPSFAENPTPKDQAHSFNSDTINDDETSSSEEKKFFSNKVYEDFSEHDELIDALYESLVGRVGKKSSQSPARRLNKRNLASDISENIYISKTDLNGKHLNINIIIDTSGSMNGSYIDDAVAIAYIFNELAYRGVVTGNIMLSCSGLSGMWQMPMKRDLIQKISAYNAGEGLRHTFAIRWKELKNSDFNIALTDGKLTDGHIDLNKFTAAGIEITGMYISRHISNKNLTKYTGGLKMWFSKSIVRNNVGSGVYAIIDSALLQLGA